MQKFKKINFIKNVIYLNEGENYIFIRKAKFKNGNENFAIN
jgi:hypothetical protein